MTHLLLLASLVVLPTRVDVKSNLASFTAQHELAVHEGRIWWRPLKAERWTLLPPDGLPIGSGRLEALKEALPPALPLHRFERPVRIDALSADGDNLVAWGPDGHVFYTKLSTLKWVDTWGPPFARQALSVTELDAVAMSHRAIAYEDIDGNSHPVSAGVTTLYALAEGGRSLRYADPWLPSGFARSICLPDRGRFVAASFSASASTIFVMDRTGRAFTRLIDFDTGGNDPALRYSWVRGRRRADVRSLPAEDWRAQPRIEGWHTTALTIAQTGATNAARELRVEGRDGYWSKPINDPAWRFVATGLAAQGRPVEAGAPPAQNPGEATLVAHEGWRGATGTLTQFNPDCSPATLVLETKHERLTLPLHFHGGLSSETEHRSLRGALLLPRQRTPLVRRLRSMAMGLDHLEVKLEVTADGVLLRRLPFLDLRFTQE